MKEWVTVATRSLVPALQGEVESVASSAETGIASFEETPHVRRYKSVREAIEGGFVLAVAQMERASGIEIDNLTVANVGADE